MAETTLGALADIKVGFPFKSSDFLKDGSGVRLLRGDNIAPGRVRWDNAVRWPETLPIDGDYRLARGDVVLAMDRPWIGAGLKAATVGEGDVPALLVQRVARLRARPGVPQGYVAALASSENFAQYLLSVQTGTAVPHISSRQIAAFPVTAVSPATQNAIAEVQGALDDKIAANTRVAAAAEGLAVALVSALPLTSTLGALVTHHRTTVAPNSLADPVVEHFSLPSFDSGKHPELAAPSSIKSGKLAIEQPSVLISKLNPRIPRIWLTPASTGIRQLASTEFLVLAPRTVDPAVLWALAMQPSFSAALEGKVAGTSGSHQRVKPADTLNTPIGDPTELSERDRFEIVTLCASAQSARAENISLAATRDALLPALMSGRLRVKDAEKVVSDAV